jgi:hypothetical protein
MIKFIYPLTSDVAYRKTAWGHFRKFCNRHAIYPDNAKLREEEFQLLTIFGLMTRRRVYTMSFKLDQEPAERLIAELCGMGGKYARILTPQLVLLTVDDDLSVDPE